MAWKVYYPELLKKKEEDKKYLTWVCKGGCGGLGDRFLGIISTFFLAILLKREFKIIYTHPCELKKSLIQYQFQLR